ncbi:hypothetical protein KF728_00780 [Candidatus Obscuribacterales bacterium]|nr:hypothetical protein [Candidatus Obscuribacterales bacterium]
MSKKAVKVRKSFVKQWIAVISGSLFASAMQAHAADVERPSFRDFREQNPGIDRQAARQMFRQEFGQHRGGPVNTIAVPTIGGGGNNLAVPSVSNSVDTIRMDRLSRRLERQGVINQSVQGGDGTLVNLRNGVNLDLGSDVRNITLGRNLFDSKLSVEINVGGETKTVAAGSQVSAAEYIAVKQILSGNSQKIVIDGKGAATGGEVDLGAITANNDVLRATDLTVPVNVTTYGDFSKRSDFKLLGDLNNAGTVYTYGNGRNGGVIRADDIVNQLGASITADSSLGLLASGNLSNYGTITSKGTLTLSAGNVLTNAGNVNAKGDVNLNASSINNSGAVQAVRGDINIDGSSTAELNVNGAGGTFSAGRDINVRAADYVGSSNTNLNGGDYLSRQLNLNAGAGILRADVGELTGLVNQTGSEAHLSASTDDLNIGNVCLTGDPTYKNNAGNININGNISVNEKLAIIASGNITSANNITISTAQAGGGFDILMAAGAEQTAGGTNVSSTNGAVASGTTLTGFASSSGGSILLGSGVTIDSRGTSGNANGGDVSMFAFSGLNFNSGRIDVSNTTIRTGGSGTGTNGDVFLVAGAQSTTAIRLGGIDTTGGAVESGLISAVTAQPVSTGGPIVFDAAGNITSPNNLTYGALPTGGDVIISKNLTSQGGISITADGIVTLGAGVVLTNTSLINSIYLSGNAGVVSGGNASLLVSDRVELESFNGNIGSASNRVRIDANDLAVNSPTGSFYVSDIDDVSLSGFVTGGTADLTSTGLLTVSNAVPHIADHVVLRSTAGAIQLNADVTGTTDVRLRANGNIDTALGVEVTSPQTYLTSDTGTVTARLTGGNVAVTANNAVISSTGAINFAGGDTFVTNLLQTNAAGNISSTSNIFADIVQLVSSAGSLSLGSVITGSSQINLSSNASIVDSSFTGATIVSPELNLLSFSGSVGSVGNQLHIDANRLSATATAGDIYIVDPNSVTITNASANTNITVIAANNILSTASSVIAAPNVTLTATNGSLGLTGAVYGVNVALTSGNTIPANGLGTVALNNLGVPVVNLSLSSTNGSIGSLGSRVATNAENLVLNAANGVYVINTSTSLQTDIEAGSSAGTDFFVSTNNDLSINAGPTAGRNIELASTAGDLFQDIAAPLATTGGYIKLSGATGLVSSGEITASGNVILESGSTLGIGPSDITSTAGDVNVTGAGNVEASTGVGTISAFGAINIVSSGGFVSINKSLETSTGNISLTASGAAIFPGTGTVTTPLDFNITGASVLFTGGTVDAQNVTLKSTAFFIFVGSQLSASQSITLDSATSIDNTSLASPTILDAEQINLKAVANIGQGIGNPLDIDAVNLNLQGGTVAVHDPNSVNINGTNTSSLDFIVTADDDLTTSGVIGAGDFGVPPTIMNINLTAGGLIEIGANMYGANVSLASSTDMNTVNGAQIRAQFLTLSSTSGDIGTDASSRLNTKSLNLTVNTGGSAYVFADAITGLPDLNLIGNSVVTGTFDLARPDEDLKFGNIVIGLASTVSANDLLLSAPRGFLTVNGTTTGTNSVTLNSAGPITNASTTGLQFTDTLNLKSTFGGVGLLGDSFIVNANNFSGSAGSLMAPGNSVYATRTGALNIVGTNFSSGTFSVDATGALTVTGTISSPTIDLASSGAKVQIPGSLIGNVVSITSDNGIVDADLSGTFNIFSVNLTTTAGNIDVSVLDVNSLAFNSAGSVTYSDSNSVSIYLASSALNDISVTANQNLSSVSGALIQSTTGSVSLTAMNGVFDLDGGVRAAGTISLTSAGDINGSTVSGVLDGGVGLPVQSLVLQSDGNIGAAGGQANAFAFNALAISAGADNAYLNNTGGAIDLRSSSVTGDLALWSTGTITVPAAQTVVADSLYLNSANGGILIPGAVTIGSRIELISFNNILTANFANPLSAPTIVLNATNAGATINVTADFQNVSASATTVVLTDTTGSMNIGPGASTATSFTASAPVNISNDGTIDAATVSLTATAGGFTFNNAISGTTSITLTSGDDILNGVGLGQLITPTLVATSTNGDIGTALDPLSLNVTTVTLNAALGNVWVENAGAVTVGGASSAQGIFSLHANGLITVDSTVNASDVDFTAIAGSSQYVQINAAVTGTTSVTVSSDNGIVAADGMNNIVSPRINLVTTVGPIGFSGNSVLVDTAVLSIQSVGNAFVSDSNSVDLAASSAVGTLNVTAANDLTSSGTVSAADVTLTATTGSLTLNGLTRGTNSITLSSAGSILNANIAGGLDSGAGIPVAQLNLTSTGGDIGAGLDFLQVDVDNITANATTGSVFVQDANAMNFGPGGSAASNAAGEVFQAIAGGALTSSGAISGNAVRLQSGDKFDLDGAVTATTQIRLDAQNDILNADITGGLNSPDLYLTSALGSIGESLDFLLVNASTASLSAGGSVYFTSTAALTLQTIAAATDTFIASSNLSLLVNTAVSGTDVRLDGATGLTLNADVTGTNSVGLVSFAGLTQTSGTVIGGALNVDFVTGPVTLVTNVSSLTASGGSTQTLTINERDGINVISAAVGTFNLNASQIASGNVLVSGDIDASVVSIVNAGGNVTIDADVDATTSLTINTSAGSGFIQQTSGTLTTPTLTVLAAAGGIGGAGNDLIFTNGANPVSLTANATGGGDVAVVYAGTGTVNVQATAGNDFFTLDTTNGGSVNLAGGISGTGTLNLITNNLTSNVIANFNQISVSNTAGALSMTGGTYTTANGFTVLSAAGINLSGTILLNGTGEAAFTVGDEPDSFIVNAGAVVTGVNRTTINACDLTFDGIITGNPLVIVCSNNGTIANSNGDVLLPSDLVFVGQNLAILAAGNITTTGSTSINLSGPTGGGSLTLMAGYDFTPATAGQIQSPGLFTITGVNGNGGSIELTNVTINLNGGSGSGGNFTAVANAGTLNDGSIVLHTINTTGALNGGNVNITGPGGITVGSINTVGGTASGNVSMAVATPTIVGGPITVQNGVLLSGSFGVGAQTAGDLIVTTIDAGLANVVLTGALGATDVISQTPGLISANNLTVNVGDGTATLGSTAVANLNASSSGLGTVDVSDVDALNLGTVTGSDLSLFVSAGGSLVATSAFNVGIADLTTTAGDIVLNASVGGSNYVELSSAGTITQTTGTLQGGTLFLDFATGPVTLSTNVDRLATTANAVTLTINEANDLILSSQGVDVLNVNVTSGAVTTDSNFSVGTLNINVADGTVAVSNSIGATGTTNVFADDGVTSSGAGVINGDIVVLDTNASLGVDAANRLQINANTFQVEGQNVFVNNTNTLASTLNASSATNTLDVSTAGDLVSGGDYSAQVVALATGGAFDLTSRINGTTSVSLTTDGDLTNITGTLNTPTLLLNSVSGNVGTDANNPFLVAANVSSIGGSAGNGFFVSSASTAGVNFVAITAAGDINLTANGGLNLTQNITSTGGAFAVTATQDTLDIADGITILAHDQIDITMLGSTKKRDSIVFGNGSSVLTNAKTPGLGNINIVLGAPQSPGRKTPTPKKFVTIVENGGSVLFGGKKAQAVSGGIVFTAQGADVYVSTFNPKSIVFEGNNIITADPPVAEGTPTTIRTFGNAGSAANTLNVLSDLSINSLDGSVTMSPVAITNPVATFSVNNEMRAMQLISLNNATGTFSGGDSLASLTSTASGVTLATVPSGGSSHDDSYISTSEPTATIVDAKLCSDLELSGDSLMSSLSKVSHNQCVTMDSGSVLFVPKTDTTVVTPKGRVKIAADSVAMVVVDQNHLSVYDVNDQHKRSVVIEAGGRSIPLSPGKHAIVTHSSVQQFAEINPVEAVMHRGLAHHDLGNGHKAFTSEFSVPSAIQAIKPLAAIVQSQHREARKVRAGVLKTTAVIMQMTSNGPAYELHTKPRTVALQW